MLRVDGTTVTSTARDSVFIVQADRTVRVVAQSPQLHQPNGITVLPNSNFLIATRGASELYELTPKGDKINVRTVPGKIVDSVGRVPDGSLFASSWGNNTESVFGKLAAPAADFHFDLKRNRILLPLLRTNALIFTSIP